MECCFQVTYLYVGSRCRFRHYLYYRLLCVYCFFLNPPLFLFFVFGGFVNGVCGLRWMCCGGSVAYYVECTNVVKKWYGSDCVNPGYQGRRGWFFKLRSVNKTSSV